MNKKICVTKKTPMNKNYEKNERAGSDEAPALSWLNSSHAGSTNI